MDIRQEIESLNDELINLRRDFHQHPELGGEEFRTAQRVEGYLRNCGLTPRRVTPTGVAAALPGSGSGRTLILRADMDALPVPEQTGLPFKSAEPGRMHACGHDGHTAMLLVAAKVLSQHRQDYPGQVVFVFQPDEENSGALPMIEAGLLRDYPADACLGMHLWPALPTGQIGLSAGAVMAGLIQFRVEIMGKGGHTGYPQQAIDPVLCAANVIQSLQMIQTREVSALEPTILVIGKVSGGTASNIIPDTVSLEGTARYLHEDKTNVERDIRERIERILAGVCAAHRAKYEFTILASSPALVNDSALVEAVRPAVLEVFGDEQNLVRVITPVGEDFSEFTSRIPGVFAFLGCGNEAKGACYPHHHPRFDIDEGALKTGVELHVRTALQYLGAE
ncbi:MAG: M20 metallopeptidase family protein [Chloroflexota bacterium]